MSYWTKRDDLLLRGLWNNFFFFFFVTEALEQLEPGKKLKEVRPELDQYGRPVHEQDGDHEPATWTSKRECMYGR